MLGKLIKFLLILALFTFAIVSAYAYFGDMSPVQEEVETDLLLGGPASGTAD
jgi:hypothetical protein